MQFNTAITYDLAAKGNFSKTLEIENSYKKLNDPNGAHIKNNFFLRCQEDGTGKFCPKMEFSLKTLWPSKDVSETRGYLHNDLEVDRTNTRYGLQKMTVFFVFKERKIGKKSIESLLHYFLLQVEF